MATAVSLQAIIGSIASQSPSNSKASLFPKEPFNLPIKFRQNRCFKIEATTASQTPVLDTLLSPSKTTTTPHKKKSSKTNASFFLVLPLILNFELIFFF